MAVVVLVAVVVVAIAGIALLVVVVVVVGLFYHLGLDQNDKHREKNAWTKAIQDERRLLVGLTLSGGA